MERYTDANEAGCGVFLGETLLILLHLDTCDVRMCVGQIMRILMCGLVLFVRYKYL
jgi:hypothetical protein